MTSYHSTEELFQASRDLMARLEQKGHREAAAELRDGFGSLNGLTDGWALFLQSIEKVQTTASKVIDSEDRQALKDIRAAVHAAVTRR